MPDFVLLPDHEPLDVHALALVLDHVSVEEPPDAMLVGAALSVTVGTGRATATVVVAVAEPPVPVQVNV